MGKTRTPKYALEMDAGSPHARLTSMSWWVRKEPNSPYPGNGAPTLENLTKYVMAYIDSLKVGGANYHISKALGYMPIPNWARIVHNDGSRRVVVEWKAPAFMVI